MPNKVASDGQVFLCGACGKRSKDLYGDQKIDRGWDVSCMMSGVLVYENSIIYDEEGNPISATEVPGNGIEGSDEI